MNVQTQKLNFIEEYLRLSNQSSLEKLESLLRKERQKELKEKLKPMSIEELNQRIRQSEEDIQTGKIYTQQEVEDHFKRKLIKR